MVPAGTAHRDSKCRITSCCCLCLPIRLSLIRWKMCGSSCAATGSVIGCGKPTKPSSTLANTLGTSSCDCPSASLRSPHALGQNQSPDRPTGITGEVGDPERAEDRIAKGRERAKSGRHGRKDGRANAISESAGPRRRACWRRGRPPPFTGRLISRFCRHAVLMPRHRTNRQEDMAELRADGQRVLVTAGASGIGRAIAEALAEAGARVHICDVDGPALDDFRRDLPELGATNADVSSVAAVDQLFREVQTRLGGLDVLVNNAGLAGPTGPVEEIDPAAWRGCLEVGLTGQFLCARRAVPLLKGAGRGPSSTCLPWPAGSA